MSRELSRDPKADAALGHASLLVAEVEEDLRVLEREARAASPSSPGFDEDFVKEVSTVAARAAAAGAAEGAAAGLARAQMATVPDSEPAGISVQHGETHVRARGWVAVLAVALGLALAAAVVGTAWLLLRSLP